MDVYQTFRMNVIWPVIVGCVAFYVVCFIASGRLTRWQAVMAGVVAVMAGVVARSIAQAWEGTEVYWLGFTLGLAFAALVLLANVIAIILEAQREGRT